MRTRSSSIAWAISMRSKGSRCGPGNAPAACPWSIVIGKPTKPWPSITPARSLTIGLAPGSLPNRCLVEISQIDAALTKTGSNSSFMASRARALSFSSPANHQRKACVSSRRRVTSLPLCQLGVGHWLEKLRSYSQHALECAELTLGRRRIDGRETRDWSSAPRDNDFFSGLNSREKLGKIGLRSMYGHSRHLALPTLVHTLAKGAARVHRACEQSGKHGCVNHVARPDSLEPGRRSQSRAAARGRAWD